MTNGEDPRPKIFRRAVETARVHETLTRPAHSGPMRISVFLLSLALAAAPALAGHAQSDDAKAKPAPKMKLPASLRGPVSPQVPLGAAPPAPSTNASATTAAIAPKGGVPAKQRAITAMRLASPIASAKPDLGQCRTACAHTYYFCQAGPSVTDCAGAWGQCLSDCSFPPLTLRH